MTTDDGEEAVPAILTYRPPLAPGASLAGTVIEDRPLTVHDALVTTAIGLREPDRWCQHILFWAIDPVRSREADPFAGRWRCCLLGMLWIVTIGVEWWGSEWNAARARMNPDGNRIFDEAHAALKIELSGQTVAAFNDRAGRTLPEVLALVDRTAATMNETRETTTE